MSEIAAIKASDFIKIDPRKELKDHLWYGRLWKVAAVTTLVAYTALSVVAAIATGILAPIYLPIVMTVTILLADCAYNNVYDPINNKAKFHTSLAKINQGIVDQLKKISGKAKQNYLKARYNYFKKHTKKCEKKIKFYKKRAEEENDNRYALTKAGSWFDKMLRDKSSAAFCKAVMENKEVEAPEIIGKGFSWRALEKKFLKENDFLELDSGVTLSARQVEKMSIKDLSQAILDGKVEP